MNKLNYNEIKALQSKGFFTVDENVRTMDGGVAGLTSGNNFIPAGLLTNLSPDMVKVITRKRTADSLVGPKKKVLDWAQNDVVIPVLEQLGEAQAYSDYGTPSAVGVNPTFVNAGHYRYFTKIQVGALESEQLSLARIAAEAEKTAAALEVLAIQDNNISIFGLASVPEGAAYPVRGLLNTDTLPAYEAMTTTGTTATFATIYEDVQSMISEIIVASNGHIDPTSKFVLAIPSGRSTWLGLVNDFGRSVLEILKINYPNLEIVLSPELAGAYTGGLDAVYMRAEAAGLGNVADTAVQGFSEFARASAVEVKALVKEQVLSAGTVGAIVYRPYLFARRYLNTGA